MNLPVLIGVVLYQVIVIGGISWYLHLRTANKQAHAGTAADFTHSSGSLGALAVGVTAALASLGGGHILGLPAQAAATGVGTYWYCLASGLQVVIMMGVIGPWYRRLNYPTITHFYEAMFDRRFAIVQTALSAGYLWGIITLETQGAGTVLAIMTGWDLTLACIIGGLIAMLYIVFAGMKEAAWVNVFNAAFMYLGIIVAALYVGGALPNGWAGVNDYYKEQLQANWMLNITGTAETWKTYILGTIVGSLCFGSVNQGGYQSALMAKSTKALKRSMFWAIPINVVFGAFTIAFGMAAASLPEYTSVYGGGPMLYMAFLCDCLPTWALIWLLAGFIAAILSTVAICMLGLCTSAVDGIVIRFFKPDMNEKQHLRLLRICIVAATVLTAIASTLIPSINTSMVWLFSWMLPAFWMLVFGLFWKRSKRGVWLVVICGVVNCLWTFTSLPDLLGLPGSTNSIALLVVAIIGGAILVGTDKNAKPSILKTYKQDKSALVYDPARQEEFI